MDQRCFVCAAPTSRVVESRALCAHCAVDTRVVLDQDESSVRVELVGPFGRRRIALFELPPDLAGDAPIRQAARLNALRIAGAFERGIAARS